LVCEIQCIKMHGETVKKKTPGRRIWRNGSHHITATIKINELKLGQN